MTAHLIGGLLSFVAVNESDPVMTLGESSGGCAATAPSTLDRGTRLLLALMIVIGLWFRSTAIERNEHPHGDVHLDALTLRELAAGNGFTTPLVRSTEYRDSLGATSYPLDQHPPLALLLGLALEPLAGSAYRALQYASFLNAIALLVAVFALCRRWFDFDRALFATAVCAVSFALIDFAGNGAVYSQHALLALLAIHALGCPGLGGGVLTGVVLGLAYLTNYQALVFLPAAALAIVAADRGSFQRVALPRLVGVGVGFAVACAPWWWRNAAVFGDATYSVNPFYFKWRLGGTPAVTETADTTLLTISWPALKSLVGPVVDNVVVNARFIATQSTLWCGGILLLALAAVPRWWREGWAQRDARPLALLGFAAAHLAIMVIWPGCKFRYFVPWIPLLAVLASGGLWSSPRAWSRRFLVIGAAMIALVALQMIFGGRADDGAIALAGLALGSAPLFVGRWSAQQPRILAASFVVLQIVLFVVSPTRTAYYDAILIRDQFRERGTEARDRARQRALTEVAEELTRRDVRAIVADVELAYHMTRIGRPIVVIQPPAAGDPEVDARALEKAMRRHAARYVLAIDPEVRAAYSTFPGFEAEEPILDGRAHLLRFHAP